MENLILHNGGGYAAVSQTSSSKGVGIPPTTTNRSQQGNTKNIYVASLPPSFTDAKLYELMEPFGSIVSARVMSDAKTGQCKGYGFVLFESEKEAATAINSLICQVVEGHRLQVRFAHAAASPTLQQPSQTPPGLCSPSEGSASLEGTLKKEFPLTCYVQQPTTPTNLSLGFNATGDQSYHPMNHAPPPPPGAAMPQQQHFYFTTTQQSPVDISLVQQPQHPHLQLHPSSQQQQCGVLLQPQVPYPQLTLGAPYNGPMMLSQQQQGLLAPQVMHSPLTLQHAQCVPQPLTPVQSTPLHHHLQHPQPSFAMLPPGNGIQQQQQQVVYYLPPQNQPQHGLQVLPWA